MPNGTGRGWSQRWAAARCGCTCAAAGTTWPGAPWNGCTRQHGWEGVPAGKRPRTTIPDQDAARPAGPGRPRLRPGAPNRLWVADFTYVPTWTGMVYVAFVVDAFARRMIGWRAATHMKTTLVLDALEQAIFTRANEGVADLTGLVTTPMPGSQYVSIALHPTASGRRHRPSVGSVGDAYDNALAETTVGLFKTEQINRNGPWRDINAVEVAAFEWVDFFNTERPHEYLDDLTPIEAEKLHYDHFTALPAAG